MKRFLMIACAAIALAACAQTYGDVAGSFGTYGVGGAYQPGGAATASIGATQGDFVYATTLYKDGSGHETPFKVDAGCNREDVPSIYGSLTGNATAGSGQGGPSLSLNVGRGLMMGEPARLAMIATVQAAYGQSSPHDAMADYQDCSKAGPPDEASAASH